MAKLKINEHRYIDIDHIADIQYTPASEREMIIPFAVKYGQDSDDDDDDDVQTEPVKYKQEASLSIELKKGDTIDLKGEEADIVWQKYRATVDTAS
jgi:hypothetical protein